MKFLPVVTVGAIGSVMAAASILPAYATVEPVLYVRTAVGSEITAPAESEESETSQDVPSEGNSLDGADVAEIEIPDAEVPALEAEVVPQEDIAEVEVAAESDVAVSEAAVAQAAETPVIEPIEILSALPAEEDLSPDASEVSGAVSVPPAVAPADQQPATQSALPSVQESPAAAVLPSLGQTVSEAGSSSLAGSSAEREPLPADEHILQAAEDGKQDTPPEPRPIETINPAVVNDDNDPSKSADTGPEAKQQGPASEQARDQEFEAAESPAEKPLPQTGSPAASIAVSGVLLLIVGTTLVSWHRRVSE